MSNARITSVQNLGTAQNGHQTTIETQLDYHDYLIAKFQHASELKASTTYVCLTEQCTSKIQAELCLYKTLKAIMKLRIGSYINS